MEKVAIITQTFLRDNLMMKTVNSIMDNWQDNYVLFIGDQNKDLTVIASDIYNKAYKDTKINIKRYKLLFDCGLSFSRNFLINKAHEMGIKYVLISADSIAFNNKYNFEPMINFIKSRNNNAIVGLKLANRQPFEYDMTIDRELGKFILDKPARGKTVYEGMGYQRCDIVKNFFIAPTELLIKYPWNNELKLAEHEDEFLRLKENNVEVYYNDTISANYIDEKPDEYKIMRNRLYSEFVTKMRRINGMADNDGGWIQYNYRNF